MKKLFALALSSALFLSCTSNDKTETNAIIQAYSGGTVAYVMLTISDDLDLECLDDSSVTVLQKTLHETETHGLVIIQLDSTISSLNDLEVGTQTGLFANSSENGFETDDRADLDIEAITVTRVNGTYQLTDNLGAAVEERKSFRAKKCPDYH
jgi:hypothetical protein